jgi:transcriptional regulator with XRE-family HTH domain
MSTQREAAARNRALQVQWYGESLGERFRRLLTRLDLSQAQLAEILGLSPPMLSQLMSGHRAKLSNPAVLSRLLLVEGLVADPSFDTLGAAERQARLQEIRAGSFTFGVSTPGGPEVRGAPRRPASGPRGTDVVASIQALLRATASAAEIDAAAALLDRDFPDLAAVLRVYGNGRTADARAHFARVMAAP